MSDYLSNDSIILFTLWNETAATESLKPLLSSDAFRSVKLMPHGSSMGEVSQKHLGAQV